MGKLYSLFLLLLLLCFLLSLLPPPFSVVSLFIHQFWLHLWITILNKRGTQFCMLASISEMREELWCANQSNSAARQIWTARPCWFKQSWSLRTKDWAVYYHMLLQCLKDEDFILQVCFYFFNFLEQLLTFSCQDSHSFCGILSVIVYSTFPRCHTV